jgi:hypothetical protein
MPAAHYGTSAPGIYQNGATGGAGGGGIEGTVILVLIAAAFVYSRVLFVIQWMHPFFAWVQPFVAIVRLHPASSSVIGLLAFGAGCTVLGMVAFMLTLNWFRLVILLAAMSLSMGWWVGSHGFKL